MKIFRKDSGRLFVRAREEQHETKLESAELRHNLVHEEFRLDVTSVYDFSHGKDAKEVGGFGEVQAVVHRKTGKKYAMKTVKLSGVKTQKQFEFIMKEVDLLKSLDHPNIVRLQEVYISHSHIYMAMDLITGGNLAGEYRCEGEEGAAAIVRQVVRALRYLHDRNIAHRDLKLENILVEANTGGDEGGSGGRIASIKLVDFGLSVIYHENGVSTDVLGSWDYVAPEVIKGHYRPAPADMWSLGVVSYVLISRRLPFHAESTEGTKRNILSTKFDFKGRAWAGASQTSKHFVRSLLLKSPDLRLTAEEAQKHDWLKGAEDLSQVPQKCPSYRELVTRSLLDFREANPMKQLALEVVARTLDPAQIRQLAEEFDRADSTNNGEVSLAEFKSWLEANGADRGMSREEVQALFNSVDTDRSGSIHFNEFLAATLQQRQLDEAHLRPAFDRLDRSHTGFINLEDVRLTTGARADTEKSRVILSHFDMNGDGQISFEEFVNGMRRIGGSTREGEGLLAVSLGGACPERLETCAAAEAADGVDDPPPTAAATANETNQPPEQARAPEPTVPKLESDKVELSKGENGSLRKYALEPPREHPHVASIELGREGGAGDVTMASRGDDDGVPPSSSAGAAAAGGLREAIGEGAGGIDRALAPPVWRTAAGDRPAGRVAAGVASAAEAKVGESLKPEDGEIASKRSGGAEQIRRKDGGGGGGGGETPRLQGHGCGCIVA